MVGKERAAEAIRTLYRLDKLDDVSRQVSRLVDEKQQRAASVSTASERKGVTRWSNAVDSAMARKVELQRVIRARQARLKVLEEQARELRAQIIGHVEQDGTLKRRKEELAAARVDIDVAIVQATADGLAVLRSPGKLHPRIFDRLHSLGSKLNQLKLPKTISEEFFRELAEQERCVCGRPLGHLERQAVLDGAKAYLAEDQIAVINAMKQALRNAVNDGSDYSALTATLRQKLKELQRNKTANDQLELERIEAGDAEVEVLRVRERQVLDESRQVEETLERLTTKDPARQRQLGLDHDTNLPLCVAELRRCQEKLATATDTWRFMLQAEFVRSIIDRVGATALELLRERVRLATNEKLAHFAPSEALQVGRIAGSLELGSPGNALKSDVSEGQSLAVAYAFLTSLLTDAPYQLPFIIDSPAVSLDRRMRQEVGQLIPELFGQMIMFVISSEKDGFAEAFYGRKGVRYLTLWRETEDITATRVGLAAFKAFHSDEGAR
jgi:DNA sulfur modification protein DndD